MKTAFIALLVVLFCIFASTTATQVEQKEDILCDICKIVVKFATGYVNNTRDEIKEKLNAQCAKLPKGVDSICKTFVALYGDELIDYIIEPGNNPEKFCADIKLCKKTEIITPESPVCDICQLVVTMARNYLDGSVDEILAKLSEQCNKLPDGADKICKTFVLLYGRDMIQWLLDKTKDPKKFCHEIGLCSTEMVMTGKTFYQHAIDAQGPVCEVCKFAVRAVVGYINGSADEIIEKVSQQCDKLPDGADKICKTFVLLYGRDLIKWVVDQGRDPHKFCASIGLCSADVQIFDITPQSPVCELCQFVTRAVVGYINGSADEIIEKLGGLCEKLPDGADKICKTFVLMYGRDLIKWVVEKGRNPREFCKEVGLCSPNHLITVKEFGAAVPHQGPVCTVCEMAVKFAVGYINNTKDEILDMISKQCEKLPEGADKLCKTFVLLYGKDLLNWIIDQGRDPRLFCASIGLCQRTEVIDIDVNGPACDVCKFAVRAVVGYINGSADEIIEKVSQQCDKLPDGADKICKTFVLLYGRDLIKWVVDQGRDPHKFCASIGLCSGMTAIEFYEQATVESGPVCEICKFAVRAVVGYINGSADEILEKLGGLCEKLPDGADKICKTFVLMYGRDLIKWVVDQGRDPHQFCASLGACASVTVNDNSPVCRTCEYVFGQLTQLINTTDDEEILKRMGALCDKLPEGASSMCRAAVSIYGRELIRWVREQGKDVRGFCKKIGLCKDQTFYPENLKKKAECIFKCVKGKYKLSKILKVVLKCLNNVACYGKELGKDALQCAAKCI